jgi:hypothetical protein
MIRTTLFRLLAALLIAAGATHVATLAPRVIELAGAIPAGGVWVIVAYCVSGVTALLACLLAGFLLWKAPDRPAARALTLFLAFLAIFWGSLFRFVEVSADSESLTVGLTYGSGWASQSALAAFLLGVAAFLRFTALFPRPLTGQRLRTPRFRGLRRIREATFRAVPVWGTAVVLYVGIRYVPDVVIRFLGPAPFDESAVRTLVRTNLTLMGIGYVVIPTIALAVGVANLWSSYRLADPEERRRMTWVTVGFSTATWLMVAAAGAGIVVGTFDLPERIAIAVPVLFGVAPLLVVVGAAIGVLYGGAIDPRLTLQRSTVYGALAAVAVVAFAALENALSSLIEVRLGLPGFAGSAVAGGIVAALLIPVRRPLQRIVRSLMARLSDSRTPAASP